MRAQQQLLEELSRVNREIRDADTDEARERLAADYQARLKRSAADEDPLVASVAYVAPWPSLNPVAFHGLPGDFVRLVEPHSEADPAALLVQFLVAVGNQIGRGPYFPVEADQHGLNLYAVMVGGTSKGRKGTSWGHVKRVVGLAEPDWLSRVKSGVSSGEGIVYELRDPTYRKGTDGHEEDLIDEGVADKRLLLIEPEFANVLKVAVRQGNTVTTVLRDGWDDVDVLSPLTKNTRIKATNPHISLIGHITKEELLRHLTETDAANGFGNRFLWVCVKRSKLLPRGGNLSKENLQPIMSGIQAAVHYARTAHRIDRTEETWQAWDRLYGPLSEGKPGLLGAMIGRAEAQVTRLSALYAILNGTSQIHPEHQAAAVAVWDYCEASARWVFGEALGDPVADEILRALRRALPEGLDRTAIRNLFSRHKGQEEVGRALGLLQRQELAYPRPEATSGRPREVWYATCDKSDKSDQRGSA